MNNYLITIFKQDDSVEHHTLAYENIHLACMGATELLKMLSESDSTYDDAGLRIGEVKIDD